MTELGKIIRQRKIDGQWVTTVSDAPEPINWQEIQRQKKGKRKQAKALKKAKKAKKRI